MQEQPVSEAAVIRRLSLVSIIGNAVLTTIKLLAGVFGHSGAMVSDAIHSLSDVLTTVIAYFGVRVSKKAADAAHPYGHERIECVASLFLGLMLLGTGVGIGWGGIRNIVTGAYRTLAVPGLAPLLAAVLSIVSKEAMYRYTVHWAKRIHSSAFMADAWHHRSDALSSIGSLIGIGGAMLGFPVMDSAASVVICLFIVKVAYDILKDALAKMLDTSAGEEVEGRLRACIAAQPGVVRVDVLHTRMFGSRMYVDAEIAVDGSRTIREGHAIAERVHDEVERSFPDTKHIMVHVNPAEEPGSAEKKLAPHAD